MVSKEGWLGKVVQYGGGRRNLNFTPCISLITYGLAPYAKHRSSRNRRYSPPYEYSNPSVCLEVGGGEAVNASYCEWVWVGRWQLRKFLKI